MTQVIRDLRYEDYASLPGISATDLKRARVSMFNYRYCQEHPPEPTDAMALGSAVHSAVLTPDRFAADYIAYDGTRRGKEWDAFRSFHAATGKTILTRTEYDKCSAMSAAVHHHPAALPLLARGEAELSLQWDRDGILCKCRLDMLGDVLVELKTAADITPRGFTSQSYKLGYHLQYAWYSDGIEAVFTKRPAVVVIAVESKLPHDVVAYNVDPTVIEEGHDENRALLERMAACEKADRWPGISDEPLRLLLPRWALADEDDLTITIEGEEVRV